MHCDALSTMEYLDHPGGGADIDLAPDEAVRDRIEEGLELDMIIRRDPRQPPFGELVILGRKGCEGWTLDRLEEMATADTEPAHDMIVDACEHISDRGIRLGKREECLFAQAAEDAALSKAHGVLDLGLILRASRPSRKDTDTVVGCHHAVAAVDLGIMEAGTVDAGLQVVRHHKPWHATKKANMRTCEPIQSGKVWVHVASAKV